MVVGSEIEVGDEESKRVQGRFKPQLLVEQTLAHIRDIRSNNANPIRVEGQDEGGLTPRRGRKGKAWAKGAGGLVWVEWTHHGWLPIPAVVDDCSRLQA